jgi:hypothetical protein
VRLIKLGEEDEIAAVAKIELNAEDSMDLNEGTVEENGENAGVVTSNPEDSQTLGGVEPTEPVDETPSE